MNNIELNPEKYGQFRDELRTAGFVLLGGAAKIDVVSAYEDIVYRRVDVGKLATFAASPNNMAMFYPHDVEQLEEGKRKDLERILDKYRIES